MSDQQPRPHRSLRCHSLPSTAKVFWRPGTSGKRQRVSSDFGTNKLSPRCFHRRILKTQDRILAVAFAGWAQIWRPANAVRAWLWRIDHSAASDVSKFVALKLIGVLQRASKLQFKVAFLLLERRERVVLRLQRVLETEDGHPRASDLFEEAIDSLRDLASVALSDKPFSDRLCPGKGRDGHSNFIEHGCPSDGSVRVEEPALSVGAGGPPSAPMTPGQRAN